MNFSTAVGVPGIEPGPHVPKTWILPIYYTPKNQIPSYYNSILKERQMCEYLL